MVSFRSSFILLATAINVAFTFPVEERSLSDLNADFETLQADLAAISSDVNSLPGSGADGLNALNTDSSKFIADVQQTTSDVTSTGLLNEADAESLLSQEIGPTGESLISLLGLFVTQKPAFDELSAQVPGLIQDTEEALEQFAGTVQDLNAALGSNNPPDVVSQGAGLSSSLAVALETAIAAFSD